MPTLTFVELENPTPETIYALFDAMTTDEAQPQKLALFGGGDGIGLLGYLDALKRFGKFLPLLLEFSDLFKFGEDLTPAAIEAKLVRLVELAEKLADMTDTTADDWAVGVLVKAQDAGLLGLVAELVYAAIGKDSQTMQQVDVQQFTAAGIDPATILQLIQHLANLFYLLKLLRG